MADRSGISSVTEVGVRPVTKSEPGAAGGFTVVATAKERPGVDPHWLFASNWYWYVVPAARPLFWMTVWPATLELVPSVSQSEPLSASSVREVAPAGRAGRVRVKAELVTPLAATSPGAEGSPPVSAVKGAPAVEP